MNVKEMSSPKAYKIDLTRSVSGFSRREKMARVLWVFAWSCVRWMPRKASRVRIAVLRLFGAKVGQQCLIERGVSILLPWNLELDDLVTLGRDVEVYNYGKVRIGAMSVVSQYSYLCTGTHDHRHPHFPLIWKDISIGSECWVAAGVWVLPGVSIADGAVVAARSVVTKDLPAWMVCGGHPCRPIAAREVVASSENV